MQDKKPYTKPASWYLYDVFPWAATVLYLNYCVGPFQVLEFYESLSVRFSFSNCFWGLCYLCFCAKSAINLFLFLFFLQFWRAFYFVPHILAFATLLFVPSKKSGASTSKPKTAAGAAAASKKSS